MTSDNSSLYLESLSVDGYRSIRESGVKFSAGLNIVIGKNGSGKSNLLRLIENFYSGIFDADMRVVKGRFTLRGTNTYEVSIDPIVSGSDLDIEPKQAFSLKINSESVKFAENPSDADWFLVTDHIESIEHAFIGAASIRHGLPDKLALWDVPLNTTVPVKTSSKIRAGELSRMLIFASENITLTRFYNLLRFTVRRFPNPAVELTFDSIKENIIEGAQNLAQDLAGILRKYSPISDVRLSPNATISLTESTNEVIINNLCFDFYSESAWRPFSQLSDGTKRVAYILSELAHFPSIPGKVIPGQIVLIDEPELGIHPKLLKELMNFVSELAGERQVIVTTHSPEVLDVLSRDELDRIIIAEYQGANGSIFRGMTSEEKITAEKYLKDMYLSDFWKYSDFND